MEQSRGCRAKKRSMAAQKANSHFLGDRCWPFIYCFCVPSEISGRESLCQYTVGAWTVPQGNMVLPALPTQDQAFLLHSCLPHEILPGRRVSQRVSENELPVAHVLAGVQAACLLELFLHLLDKSGTLLMESSCPPHPACACQAQNALCFSSALTHTSPV